MGLSPRTVEKHLQGVYARLGVENSFQAAATAGSAVGARLPEA
jgi:DNA-binding CsgD family transcriptional regulator